MKHTILKSGLTLLLVLCLSIPVLAGAQWPDGSYILDDAGLLSRAEYDELNGYADSIASMYNCGVYIVTVWDYQDYDYSYDVFDTTWNLYHDNDLGIGPNRDGIILLLSMAERDYALFVYGGAEYAFDDYGQIALEEEFLDDFRMDAWYDGFADYLQTAQEFIRLADQGDPVREEDEDILGIFIFIAFIISLVITVIFWGEMNNVRKQSQAHHYITGNGLKLIGRTDLFLRRSRTVRKIPKSSGSSGSRSGGGGSGRSGKF